MTKTLFAASMTAFMALTGCNTVSGIGADVQAGGAAIQSTAEDIKRQSY